MNHIIKNFGVAQAFVIAAMCLAVSVHAHEGHDKAAGQIQTPPTFAAVGSRGAKDATDNLQSSSAVGRPASAQAVRFGANSPDFEMVGSVQGKLLTLWIDHVKTNIPVVSGSIEIEIGEIRMQPQRSGDAWVATLTSDLAPGVWPVTASVMTEGASDLLAGEFVQPEAQQMPTPDAALKGLSGWWVVAGLVAFLFSAAALRRRMTRVGF